MTEVKKCTKCNCEYPATFQYFTRTNKGNVSSLCKSCKAEYDKQYRKKNKEKIKNKLKEYYEAHPDKLLEKKRYCKTWQDENKEHLKQYRENIKEKRSAEFKVYRLKNIDRLKENKKRWYYSNIEHVKKYREANKERDREKARQWYKTPKGNMLSRASTRKRRLMLHNSGEGINKTQWLNCEEYFNYECAYCGNKHNIEQEHLIPIINGGKNSIDNIIPACRSCNASKADKNFKDWFIMQEFYSIEKENKIMNYLLSVKEMEQCN